MKLANKVALVEALGLDPKTLVSATISLDNSSAVVVTAKIFLSENEKLITLLKEFELVERTDAEVTFW